MDGGNGLAGESSKTAVGVGTALGMTPDTELMYVVGVGSRDSEIEAPTRISCELILWDSGSSWVFGGSTEGLVVVGFRGFGIGVIYTEKAGSANTFGARVGGSAWVP